MSTARSIKKEWYSQGLCFSCRECGACCTGEPGYVWISRAEMERIAEHLQLPAAKFLTMYARKASGRISLKELANGDCIFLRDGQCSIYACRPSQCRTFPFWPENLKNRKTWDRLEKSCPGINCGQLYTVEEINTARLESSHES